jgi:hypothetical protein
MEGTHLLLAVTRIQPGAEKIASDAMTHLLQAVTKMALELGEQVLPPYSHPKSPHQFTQPQLLAYATP